MDKISPWIPYKEIGNKSEIQMSRIFQWKKHILYVDEKIHLIYQYNCIKSYNIYLINYKQRILADVIRNAEKIL